MKIHRYLMGLIALTLGQSVLAHEFDLSRPDAHAPISIMGDHMHSDGDIMWSYRYMSMDMDGMRHGTSNVSATDVFNANYTVTPEAMTMEMHMFGAMYAPSDDLTLMLMTHYRSAKMDHIIFPGAAPLLALNNGSNTFTTESSGLGDTVFSGLFRLSTDGNRHVHAGLGLSLPTGSISEEDIVPGPGGRIDRQLPAPMQLGSGTVDLLPSLTFVQQFTDCSYGIQARGTIRTHENHHDYRLGDKFNLDVWTAWNATPWLSFNAGVGYGWEDEMRGTQSDILLNPPFAPTRQTVPTAFADNYGGERIDASIGLNLLATSGTWKGHRIALDYRFPLHQDLNGYQLETESILTIGWQKAF